MIWPHPMKVCALANALASLSRREGFEDTTLNLMVQIAIFGSLSSGEGLAQNDNYLKL
ncbi:hypothetical protein [Pedobacter frigidisoli]|uniref:hypothetical protein n=1 Tax=Pedobacter frigidisoli TaxID=2530455 RepID=UPI0013F15BCB|nr:hypothetical protein [Pedobacter frigidisoli]